MTMSQRIAAELDRLGAGGNAYLSVREGSRLVELEILQSTPVGLAFASLTYRDDNLAARSPTADNLKTLADRVAGRLSYLLEPLSILEVDHQANSIELRSAKPTHRLGSTGFYQATLSSDGQFQLQRQGFRDSDRRRSRIDCQLTRECLERLVDDLAACLQ